MMWAPDNPRMMVWCCVCAALAAVAFRCRDVQYADGGPIEPSLFVSENITFARILPGRLFDVFIVGENGLGLRNLTDHPANDLNPQWSPDGTLLAFESTREGVPNIFIIPAIGGAARNVSHIERGARECSWFPDSRRIAFQGETLYGNDIYVVNLSDSSIQNLTQGLGINLYPRCSPDGQKIAFASDRDSIWGLYVAPVNGGNPQRLTEISGFDQTFTLTWSPESGRLLYNLSMNATRDVFVINVDGTQKQNLTNHAADDVGGDWSPDGSTIVFQSNRSGKDAIYRMDATGGNAARISAGMDDTAPLFSPNGSWVMFLSARRGAYEIWVVSPGGFQEEVVTPSQISDRTPRWKPSVR